MSGAAKIGCAIIGSGNIGTDLMIKILRQCELLELTMMVGIDAASDGLARARRLGVAVTDRGIDGLTEDMDVLNRTDIFFDATSARAHLAHAPVLEALGKTVIDLTPAAVGPFVVPAVNLREHLDAPNVNLITCGGQATIPIMHAISRVSPVHYGEMISSIASRSAGPGTRQNIDEFTQTTARGLERIGGAARGKAVIILNPADPPLIMRNTVYAFADEADTTALLESIHAMVDAIRAYVPGYRLKTEPIFDGLKSTPVSIPGYGTFDGLKVTVLLEVEGAAHYLPAYAGNLDIMTAAAKRTGEMFAEALLAKRATTEGSAHD